MNKINKYIQTVRIPRKINFGSCNAAVGLSSISLYTYIFSCGEKSKFSRVPDIPFDIGFIINPKAVLKIYNKLKIKIILIKELFNNNNLLFSFNHK